jgi:hypothetical protein
MSIRHSSTSRKGAKNTLPQWRLSAFRATFDPGTPPFRPLPDFIHILSTSQTHRLRKTAENDEKVVFWVAFVLPDDDGRFQLPTLILRLPFLLVYFPLSDIQNEFVLESWVWRRSTFEHSPMGKYSILVLVARRMFQVTSPTRWVSLFKQAGSAKARMTRTMLINFFPHLNHGPCQASR